MSKEYTFFMIKPEVVKNNKQDEIIEIIKENNFIISRLKQFKPNREQMEKHYNHLVNKPFFNELINYMTSGEIITGILYKENAINDWRTLMGTTNPELAEEGTIRNMFGYKIEDIIYNSVHGSDCLENFIEEVNNWYPYFIEFNKDKIPGYNEESEDSNSNE